MSNNKKPSSRKRHRWSLEPGDLVKVIDHIRYAAAYPGEEWKPMVGVVLTVYSANVYEGSSAEVLVASQRIHVESKFLIRIDRNPSELIES